MLPSPDLSEEYISFPANKQVLSLSLNIFLQTRRVFISVRRIVAENNKAFRLIEEEARKRGRRGESIFPIEGSLEDMIYRVR